MDVWEREDWDFIHKAVIHADGGILVSWNKEVLVVLETLINRFYVEDSFGWILIGVYSLHDAAHRITCWEDLEQVHKAWPQSWCVGGDWNVVSFPSERNGCHSLTVVMRSFLDFIATEGLVNPPLVGAKFIWSNNHENPSMSCIDKFLFSACWDNHFAQVQQFAISKSAPDHIFIFLHHANRKPALLPSILN